MNNRHKRRAEFARFRRETGGALRTWLVDANDPRDARGAPVTGTRRAPVVRKSTVGAASLHLLFIAHLEPTRGGRAAVEHAGECDEQYERQRRLQQVLDPSTFG